MACCLTAPSNYLNQCWFIISNIPCHSTEGSIIRRSGDTIAFSKWHPDFPANNEWTPRSRTCQSPVCGTARLSADNFLSPCEQTLGNSYYGSALEQESAAIQPARCTAIIHSHSFIMWWSCYVDQHINPLCIEVFLIKHIYTITVIYYVSRPSTINDSNIIFSEYYGCLE